MLTVENLQAYYGSSFVLQGISLRVETGSVAVLMGRNGVGKTTTLHAVCGIMPLAKGSIVIDGQDLAGRGAHEISRAGIGLVPQGRRVFPSLTVLEHLRVARGRKRATERWPIDRLFTLFPNLERRKGLRAESLSGGEQSMLAIARALRTEPRYLLMDEPTEGLAPIFVETVLNVIMALREESEIGLLVVLPELPLAEAVADHVYVMGKGSVAFEGTAAEFSVRDDVKESFIGLG